MASFKPGDFGSGIYRSTGRTELPSEAEGLKKAWQRNMLELRARLRWPSHDVLNLNPRYREDQ